MMAQKILTRPDFWHSRQGYAATGLVALLATYAVASRAIQTGSLQQYALTFIGFGVVINRFVKLLRGKS